MLVGGQFLACGGCLMVVRRSYVLFSVLVNVFIKVWLVHNSKIQEFRISEILDFCSQILVDFVSERVELQIWTQKEVTL